MAIMQYKPNRVEDAVTKLTPMIYKLAHKFSRNHKSNDFDDLVQNGYCGLLDAYDRYDSNAGSAFSSYAYQWIWAWMNDDRRKAYKLYNNTGFKPVEETNEAQYTMPLDDLVDSNRMVERMEPTARAIHVARQQGYSYREISEAMEKLGKPMTLHQIRNLHIKSLEA